MSGYRKNAFENKIVKNIKINCSAVSYNTVENIVSGHNLILLVSESTINISNL